jgi:O-antigen ligase
MGPITTVLTLAFIAWLLVRDSKRRPNLSWAVWVPTIMVFILDSRMPSEWLGQQSSSTGFSNDASGALVDQVFSLGIILSSLAVVMTRRIKWGKLISANQSLLIFFGYFLLSAAWSLYPADSVIRLVKLFGMTVLVVLVILSEKEPMVALRAVYVRAAYVAIPLSVLFIRYAGQFGRQYARNGDVTYTGVSIQKNSFGQMLLVSILFLVWDHLQSRPANAKRWWKGMRWECAVLLLMGAMLLRASQSQTSFVCLVIALALILRSGYLASRAFSRTVFLVALSLPFFLLLTQQFSALFEPILNALGRDATFTGRTDIWKHITATTVNPLIGAGFWTFWGGPGGRAIQIAMDTPVPNAHDGYLDLYLDGGALGLIVLFCFLLFSGRRLLKKNPFNARGYEGLRFAILVVVIIGNLTETSFGRPSALWFIAVLAVMDFPFAQAVAAKATLPTWNSEIADPGIYDPQPSSVPRPERYREVL